MEYSKEELKPLVNELDEFNAIPTWTKIKKQKWESIVTSMESYEFYEFKGKTELYSVSAKGTYTYHEGFLVIGMGHWSFHNSLYRRIRLKR
jgi:hypothetical protein